MSKAFDTYQVSRVVANAPALVKEGFTACGFYYFQHSAFKEKMTRAAAEAICKSGLYLWAVVENGRPTEALYFSGAQGRVDAAIGLAGAAEVGQPKEVIYFASDYDCAPGDLARHDAYFDAVNAALSPHGYDAGIYGNGLLCRHLKETGRVTKTWLTESRDFLGYHDWLPHADIVQAVCDGPVLGIDMDLDTCAPSGGGGWKI